MEILRALAISPLDLSELCKAIVALLVIFYRVHREYSPLCCRGESTGQAHRKEGRRTRFLYTLARRTWDAKSTAESAATEPQMVPSTVLGPLDTGH